MSETTSCSFEIDPIEVAEITKTNKYANSNYTNQDFWSLAKRIFDFQKEKFGDKYNNFIESDLAVMLCESQAFIGDMLSFKADQISGELSISSVKELANAFRLAKIVGFQPTAPIPCTASFSATINTALTVDLAIGSRIPIEVPSGNATITYELFPVDSNNEPILDEDIIIEAGSLTNTSIIGVEGITRLDNFTGTGESNQSYALNFFPVIFDSVLLDVDGSRWERVDYFTDSNPRKEYRVEFDSNYSAFIIFGDNKTGMIPTSGAAIVATYRNGGGTRGSIISGAVNTYQNFPVDGLDIDVAVNFVNYTQGNNGYDGDTIEDIRNKLPAYVKTQDRIVSGEDYKLFVDYFTTDFNGQVGKSTIALRNSGCASNIVDVYVLAKDGTNGLQLPSDQLKYQLSAAIDLKKMIGTYVCIRNGTIIEVDVVLDLTVSKFYRKHKEEIQSRVLGRLNDFFMLSLWEYGRTLKALDFMRYLADIKEITDVSITFTTTDADNSGETVYAKYYEIIRPDQQTINFIFE